MKIHKSVQCLFLLTMTVAPQMGIAQEYILKDAGGTSADPASFDAYWNRGESELNLYEIIRIEGGEKRAGEITAIFETTEIFHRSGEGDADSSRVSVLRMNASTRYTGTNADRREMTGVTTPTVYLAQPVTLQANFSSQDGREQKSVQLLEKAGRMEISRHQYPDPAGDGIMEIPSTYLEDDLWNRLRLDPQSLPMGKIKMLPSLAYLATQDVKIMAYDAVGSLFLQVSARDGRQEEMYTYRLDYPELDRTLSIRCENTFPYRILGFTETSGSRKGGEASYTVEATLEKTLKADLREKSATEIESLRKSLKSEPGADD